MCNHSHQSVACFQPKIREEWDKNESVGSCITKSNIKTNGQNERWNDWVRNKGGEWKIKTLHNDCSIQGQTRMKIHKDQS